MFTLSLLFRERPSGPVNPISTKYPGLQLESDKSNVRQEAVNKATRDNKRATKQLYEQMPLKARTKAVYEIRECVVDSNWNMMAHGDAQEGKWRGYWRMEWVASTLHTISEHGVFSITTADAHTLAASSRLNWRPRRFKWTRPFRRKTKSGFSTWADLYRTWMAHVPAWVSARGLTSTELGWPMYRPGFQRVGWPLQNLDGPCTGLGFRSLATLADSDWKSACRSRLQSRHNELCLEFSAILTEDFCDFPQLYVESQCDSPASRKAFSPHPGVKPQIPNQSRNSYREKDTFQQKSFVFPRHGPQSRRKIP